MFGVPPSGGPDRLKPGTPNGRFMESPFGLATVQWDHEPTPNPGSTELTEVSWEENRHDADECFPLSRW